MTITADQQTALTEFAQSLVALGKSFGIDLPGTSLTKTKTTKTAKVPEDVAAAAAGAAAKTTKKRAKKYGAVDASTPPAVREERQRLILAEIAAAGGEVTRPDWLGIAGRYGYDSRRLGGFFAKNGGAGMLAMSVDRKMVQLTSYGRERL